MYKQATYPPLTNFTDFELYPALIASPKNKISLLKLTTSGTTLSNVYKCGCIMPYLNNTLSMDLAKPLQYCTPTCHGNPPTPQAVCDGTHWILSSIENPTLPIVITGPTIIQGNLTLNSTSGGIVFDGLDGITITGCIKTEVPITI